MDTFRLDEKVAVITGANSGIGQATASIFGERGAKLALIDVKEDNLDTLTKMINKKWSFCKSYVADISDNLSLTETFNKIFSTFEKVDILVNVAGIWEIVKFFQIPSEGFNRMMDVNFTGGVNCIKLVLPGMIERQYGKIISVSSLAGKEGVDGGASHYAASKGALISLSCSLAREFGKYGININVVCPGLIETPMVNIVQKSIQTKFIKRCALRRIGKPEDVGNVIAFLASDAASFITGQSWNVCGGTRFD